MPGGSSRWDTRRQRFPYASDAESSTSRNTQHNTTGHFLEGHKRRRYSLQYELLRDKAEELNKRNDVSAVTDILNAMCL